MTNREYEIEFQKLKNNLFNNLAVYHERVTLLIELTEFEILKTQVNFKGKIIKPLDFEAVKNSRFYEYVTTNKEISLGASYLFGEKDTNPLIKGTTIGRPYCPFVLWLDPELTKFVLENEDEITKLIPSYILWNKDWTVVKEKTKTVSKK
jgi:hypothetical protein